MPNLRRRKSLSADEQKNLEFVADKERVKTGSCSFPVKYLGFLEVFKPSGRDMCELVGKVLRAKKRDEKSKRRLKPSDRSSTAVGVMFINADSLRFVASPKMCRKLPSASKNKGSLIIDQAMDRIFFCSPDRNYQDGFSYISRDFSTERWLCHSFQAVYDSGDRVSHAICCAFSVCFERKKAADSNRVCEAQSTEETWFERSGSFRRASLTERLTDPQSVRVVEPPSETSPLPYRSLERPKATRPLLMQQGSSQDFSKLYGSISPFKRSVSLTLSESAAQSENGSMYYDSLSLDNVTGNAASTCGNAAEKIFTGDIMNMCHQVSTALSNLNSSHSPGTPDF
ncbi:hypothetical protein EB796_000982 [Bugula neritina]|uniref:PID domain-containing protein n=1 Tax=Bugula neritina TaxID=10212 RepID=A0A7J7KRJ0_BUGNE|nr:hypothetical protein EB796_000982 [Bugula neritina]